MLTVPHVFQSLLLQSAYFDVSLDYEVMGPWVGKALMPSSIATV